MISSSNERIVLTGSPAKVVLAVGWVGAVILPVVVNRRSHAGQKVGEPHARHILA